jgi:lipopolysaccharide export system permease protein
VIINRAFFREAVFITVAVVVVLLALFILQGASGVFSRTGEGARDNFSLLSLVFLYPLVNLGLLLMLAMFIGLLVTLSRWYRDSEIVVLQACGIGTLALLRPVMWFALAFFVVLAVETLVVRPLVLTTIGEIEAATQHSSSTSWISGGTFTDIKDRGNIFYAERVDHNGEMANVFLNRPSSTGDRERVVVARKAKRFTDVSSGEEFLQLSEGTSYRGNAGRVDYEIMDFDHYRLRIQLAPVRARHRDVQALSSRELLAKDKLARRAEWNLRLSKPAVVFVLAALALALSYTEPRRGRYYNLFISIFLFFVYMQVLLIGETLLRRGEIPAPLGLWWVHALFGMLAAYFLWRRARGKPLVALPTLGVLRHG